MTRVRRYPGSTLVRVLRQSVILKLLRCASKRRWFFRFIHDKSLEISYLQDTQYVYPWFLKDIRTNRLISIDALRGIAALSVVFFHVHLFVYPQNIPVTSLWLKVIQFPLNFGLFGRTGVILFFVLSGFCIHLRWAKQKVKGNEQSIDFLQFWKRRMWRLYPTYSVVLIFSVGLALALGYFHFNKDFFNSLFAHLLMVQNFQPTWSTDSIRRFGPSQSKSNSTSSISSCYGYAINSDGAMRFCHA